MDRYVSLRSAYAYDLAKALSAIVWLDVGADLAVSPPGPWLGPDTASEHETSLGLHGYFPPVAQHKPSVALEMHRTTDDRPSSAGPVRTRSLPQSCLLLPSTYTTTSSTTALYNHPFNALSELFKSMAAAGIQFLGLLAAKV